MDRKGAPLNSRFGRNYVSFEESDLNDAAELRHASQIFCRRSPPANTKPKTLIGVLRSYCLAEKRAQDLEIASPRQKHTPAPIG
ncbi:MAG: hypothetical protein WBA40_24310 [Roseiarcus sp.]